MVLGGFSRIIFGVKVETVHCPAMCQRATIELRLLHAGLMYSTSLTIDVDIFAFLLLRLLGQCLSNGGNNVSHQNKLKADQPHPRNYQPTPTDYQHTDNHLRLVMVVVALCCTRQSRALYYRPLRARNFTLTATFDRNPNL